MKQSIAILGVFFVLVVFVAGVYIGKSSFTETQVAKEDDTSTPDIELVMPKAIDDAAAQATDTYEVTGEYSFSDMSGFERFFTPKSPYGAPAVIVEQTSRDVQVPDGTMGGFSLHAGTVGTMSPLGDSCTLVVEVTYALSEPVHTGKKDAAGNDIITARFDRVVKRGNTYDSCWSESGTPTRTLRRDTQSTLMQSKQTIASTSLAADKQSVDVIMKNGTKHTIRVADILPHNMGTTPNGPNGELVPTTCKAQDIFGAQISDYFSGEVILTTSSGACPFDSDFTDTVIMDPVSKQQRSLAGRLVAFSDDGMCSLQELGDGGRGASAHIQVINPYSGVISGKFDSFFMGSPLQQSFVAITKQAGAPQTLEGTVESNWFTVDGFEQGSCRVVFSTRNPKLYGGIWTFSVNVWGKNPKLIKKP